MLFLDNKYLERKRVGRIAEKRGEQSGGLPDGGMIVLMDLEWLEQEDMHLTQLAAVRVTDGWDVVDRLEAIVCPPKACLEQTGHMAFGGYSPDEIAGGISEEICRRMLCGWLTEDDTVIVWAESNRKYLRQLWNRYVPDLPKPRVRSISHMVQVIASQRGFPVGDPYTILSEMEMPLPAPKHRSIHDVEVLRLLLAALELSTDRLDRQEPQHTTPKQKRGLTGRERNEDIISRTQYHFIYVTGSDVFHRRGCRLCLNAKDIHGSVFYKTAARDHRPCKICKPLPTDELTPEPLEGTGKGRVQFCGSDVYGEALIRTKMLDGRVIDIKHTNVVGWCRYYFHPGAVSRELLRSHQMGHTPFGYRIENGVAAIDEDAAGKLRMLYANYH